MRLALPLITALAVVGCSNNPKLVSVTPKTICANDDSTLTLSGSSLQPSKVEIGRSADMGGGAVAPVAATSVSGSGTTVTAKFSANTLMPSDQPYDLIYHDNSGKTLVLAGAITVVPGISISAVDPGAVYNGVDFPTSIYGTGMGGVKMVQISTAGGALISLTGVNAINDNRADAIVPKGTAAGTYDVTVIDADGCTATLKGALKVVGDLTVSVCAIDPPFGYDMVATDVSITATGDGSAAGSTCGGKSGTFVSSPRAWLDVAGTLKEIDNVAFVSDGSITATVPKGLPDGGPYDLIVQNPDGTVGLLAGAFKVVNMPVPVISSISPTQIPTNTTPTIHIYGQNFRSPVTVQVYNPNPGAGVAAIPLTTVASPTVNAAGTEVDVVISLSALGLPSTAGYTLDVRVTDSDQGTYGEFSALAIVSSSGKPGSWTDDSATSPLLVNSMRGAGGSGNTTLAASFLYLIGGDDGMTPTAQTQLAGFDKYGNLGSWSQGHNQLAKARSMHGAVVVPSSTGVGGFVYVIGGYDGTAALKTVSRAKILLPSEAPVLSDPMVTLGGKLARGTWYYRVSAVLNGSDAANPGGEALPSSEVTAHTVDGSKVALSWSSVTNAASYRVYRTAMINGTSQTEVLLKDALTTTTFVDDGTAMPGSDVPFRQGELGVWVDVAPLNEARRYLGVALAHNPSGAAFLYAIGGDADTGYGKTIGNGATIYQTYEYAPLTDDGLTLGAWTEDTTNKLTAPRTRFSSLVGDQYSAPMANLATTAYVYAFGGANASGLLSTSNAPMYEAASVSANGSLGAWAAQSNSSVKAMGNSALITSGFMFTMGGATAAGAVDMTAAASNALTTPPSFGTLSTDPALASDGAGATLAAYGSLVHAGSHLFLLGGTSDGTSGTKRVWSDAF